MEVCKTENFRGHSVKQLLVLYTPLQETFNVHFIVVHVHLQMCAGRRPDEQTEVKHFVNL